MNYKDVMRQPFYGGKIKDGVHTVIVQSYEVEEKVIFMRVKMDQERLITVELVHDRDNDGLATFIEETRRQLGREYETVIPETYIQDLIDRQVELKVFTRAVTYIADEAVGYDEFTLTEFSRQMLVWTPEDRADPIERFPDLEPTTDFYGWCGFTADKYGSEPTE